MRTGILLTLLLPHLAFAQAMPIIKAKVVSATPFVEQQMIPKTVQQCREVQEVTQHRNSLGPSIVGALVGAAIGSQLGGGRGKTVVTSAGAAIGSKVGENSGAREHTVVKQECDPVVQYEQQEVKHFVVIYELDGHQFQTTSDTDPGKTIDIVLKS